MLPRTERQVLSPAAFMDFRYEVNRLLRGGETTQALGLGGSVVEIRHAGAPAGAVESGFPELPVFSGPCRLSQVFRAAGRVPIPLWGLGAAEEWLINVGLPLASTLEHGQICPDHVGRLLARLDEARDGVTVPEFFRLFKAHQDGERVFKEPSWFAYDLRASNAILEYILCFGVWSPPSSRAQPAVLPAATNALDAGTGRRPSGRGDRSALRDLPAAEGPPHCVVRGWEQRNRSIIASLKPGLHDEVLLEQSLKEAAKGFATAPLQWSFCASPKVSIIVSCPWT